MRKSSVPVVIATAAIGALVCGLVTPAAAQVPAPASAPMATSEPEPGLPGATGVTADPTPAPIPASGGRRELPDERTTHSRTFATGRVGEREVEISSSPLYVERDGALVDRDARWRPVAGGRVGPASAELDVTLAASAQDGDLAEVRLAGGTIGLALRGAAPVPVQLEGEVASYRSALPGVDVRYLAQPAVLKEDLLLHSPDAPRRFAFVLHVEGLRAQQLKDGTVRLTRGDGATAGYIPPPWMHDASADPVTCEPAVSFSATQSLVRVGGQTELIIEIDDGWLRDPARVYPVTVDPTIVVDDVSGPVDDTFVTAYAPANNSAATDLRVGKGVLTSRSFIRFDDTALQQLTGKQILSSRLDLHQWVAGSCEPSMLDVYAVAQAWSGATLTSWPGPSIGARAGGAYSAKGYSAACPAGTVSVPLHGVVESWVADPGDNHGLDLRSAAEGDSRWEFDHDEEGRLEVVRPPTGQDVEHTLDPLGRVEATTVVDPLGGPSQVRDLAYDRAGRLAMAQDQHTVAGGQLRAVLVVGNPASMTSADTILSNRLTNSLGYTVTVVDDAADPAATTGDVAVVASSASSLHGGWTTKAMPLVAVAGTSWNELGLSTTDPTAAASSSTVFVEDSAHRISDGPERAVPDTATWVTSARTPFQVSDASLGAGASDVVAAASGLLGSNVLVAYEATTAMVPVGAPLNAPARRAGVGFGDGALPVMTVDGWALLDNAIWWARGHVMTGDGSMWTLAYDGAGRLTTSDGPNDDVTQTYDAWGRLSTATVAGRTTTYAYNNRGLVSGLTGATTMTVAWTNARRFDQALVGSRKLDVTYDAAGRVTTTAILDGSTSRWSSAVTYDAAGRVDTRVEGATGATVTDDYGYDAAGRLTQLSRTFGAASASLTIGYDADGNRTSVDANGATTGSASDPLSAVALGVGGNDPQTWTWDLAGRLTAASDGTAHAYGADGRITQVTTPGQPTRGYGYDLFGDLTTVDETAGGVTTAVASYENDALGRPVRLAGEAGAAMRLSYQGSSGDSLAQRSPARVANPVTVTTSVSGVGRVGVWDQVRGNQLLATNSHGDVAALAVTGTGAAPHTIRVFSPFGTPAELGSNLDGLPLGYQGDLTDGGTGLVDMGARTYDPMTGRFLQADNFPGVASNPATLNRYAYANGDPINFIDPDGRSARQAGEFLAAQLTARRASREVEASGAVDGRGRRLGDRGRYETGYKSNDCVVTCRGQSFEHSQLVKSYIAVSCKSNGGVAEFSVGGFAECLDHTEHDRRQAEIDQNNIDWLNRGNTNRLCSGWGVIEDRCNSAVSAVGNFGRGAFVEGPKALLAGAAAFAGDPGAALEGINAQCNKGAMSCVGAITGIDGAVGCIQNAGGATGLGSCATQIVGGAVLAKGLGKFGRVNSKVTALGARHIDDGPGRAVATRAAPDGGGARFVGGSDGTVVDLNPDLVSLARTHADEVVAAGRRPTMVSAAYDSRSGGVFFGESGSVSSNIHPTLRGQMPRSSLEPWPVGNCAEFNACNAALHAGANLDDLSYATVRTRTGVPEPSCGNCQVSLRGAKEYP